MKQIESCIIVYDPESFVFEGPELNVTDEYKNNRPVRGVVRLSLTKNVKIKQLVVSFETTFRTVNQMDGGPERSRMMYSEAKFHEGEALTAGSQELAWTLDVPDNLSHSIRFPRGGIEYTLAARLDYSGGGFMVMGSSVRASITVPVERHLVTTAKLSRKTRLAGTLKEGLAYDVHFPDYVCVNGQEFVRVEIRIIKTDPSSPQLKELKIRLKQMEKYWRNPPLYLDNHHGLFQVLSLADPESYPISLSLPVPAQQVPDPAAEPSKTPIFSTTVRLPVPRAYLAQVLEPSTSGKRSSLATAKSVLLNTASNDTPLLPRTHSSKVKIEHVWEVVFVREGAEDVTISAPVVVGTIKGGAETVRAVEAAREDNQNSSLPVYEN